MIKVLITSAGSTNGINVIKTLRDQKEMKLFLVVADADPLAAGFYLADEHYLVPKADDSGFVNKVIKICKKEKINIVIPTFSKELPVFANNKNIFEKNGIKMAVSPFSVFNVTENKVKAYLHFKRLGVPFPKVYSEKEIKSGNVKFPVIIRPVQSSGSKNVEIARNREEMMFFKKRIKNSFVQEFMKGKEYTIDGVCDLEGKFIAASPRIRLEVKGGLAVKSVVINNSKMVDFAKIIAEGLGIIGPFNVQCISNGKETKYIEINNRFPSGGLPLAVKSGLNIPLIIVKLLSGKKVEAPKIRTGLLMTRYWDAIILEKKNNKYQTL